jgi:hypothetical protein
MTAVADWSWPVNLGRCDGSTSLRRSPYKSPYTRAKNGVEGATSMLGSY